MLVVFVVVGGILVGCGGEADIQKVDAEPNEPKAEETQGEVKEETKEEEVKEEEPKDEMLTIGDSVKFNNVYVTVKSVRKYAGNPDKWEEPDRDYFLIYDVVVENKGEKAYNLSSLMQFSVYDADGYSQDMGIFVTTRGSLDGEVGAGRKMAGEIAFDVDDSEYFEFVFEQILSSGQAIWKVESSTITE
jgi:ASC-1-like (ASCH) protein